MESEMMQQLVQLGAVGFIAGYLLRQSNNMLNHMSARLEMLDTVLIQLVENNTRVMGELKDALNSRPCLLDFDKPDKK
jgi:hypothetical protein